jgi:hypothetical protein
MDSSFKVRLNFRSSQSTHFVAHFVAPLCRKWPGIAVFDKVGDKGFDKVNWLTRPEVLVAPVIQRTCNLPPAPLHCRSMFDTITAELTTARDKLAHLRRFL